MKKYKISFVEYAKIPLIYLAMGLLWIYFSDRIVDSLITDKAVLLTVNLYKGWIYVLVTAIILYLLIARQYKKISDREQELSFSEDKYKTLVTEMQLGMALYEGQEGEHVQDYILIDVNDSHEVLVGLKRQEVLGKSIRQLFPEMKPENLAKLENTAQMGVPNRYESYQKRTKKYYEIISYRPRINQLAVIVNDTTQRKAAENQLQYMSEHDILTDLYNRRYFEEALIQLDTVENLPLSVIVADINGIKLINDSFGRPMGDEMIKKVAKIIKEVCDENHLVCRLGGDEFIILSRKTDAATAEMLIGKMKKITAETQIGLLDLSVSFGYDIKTDPQEEVGEIIKKAEDNMYSKKLFDSPSMRGKTINTIVTTLHEKNKREEQHSRRVSELCEMMGQALELPEDEIKELKTVGLLHDIGKIAINESILNKNGKLTPDEWEEMKKHPEIGYRILSTMNNLSEMAEYVLAHHERWDGKGYPKGLSGESIPLKSRIICIADAYDAMISERSYRRPLTSEEAIEELQKYSGTQFNKEYVDIFIEKVLRNKAFH